MGRSKKSIRSIINKIIRRERLYNWEKLRLLKFFLLLILIIIGIIALLYGALILFPDLK